MDELMIQDESAAPTEAAETEMLIVNGDDGKKNRSDDVMLTQGIFCLILALAVFSLKFINEEFRTDLLSMYIERMYAEPEQFLQKIIAAAENWFRK